MKKMILFMLLAWLCSIGVLSAQDQSDVTNDNLINYYVKLRALKWNVNNDGDAEESAWRWKWRTTSSYPVDCNESQWGSGNYEFCYTETKEYNTWLYPEEEMFEGANKPVTDKFYFHVKGHENDGANDCFYDQDVFNEDNNAHCYAGERTIGSIGNRNDWGYSTRDNDNRYAYQFAAVYRYSNGDAFNRPLTFGTIANGQNKYHYNSNKSAPSGSNSNCGYARNLYDNAAADVVYSFTINSPMNVTISTDHSATDFDTKVYLFSNADRIIASDNNSGSGTKSTLTRFLCAGTYKVLVGGNSNKTGNFRLRIYGVNATAITSEGSIRGPGAVCRGTNIPKITSTAAGTVSCGAVSYQWRKWNGSTYAVISGAIGAEYDPPENMGSDRLYYYRETKDQYGYTRGTDVITIRPASASANVGSISFSGSTTIPGGTDPGSFSSRTNASASPAIKAVYWEKQESTDGGISWTNWSAVTNTSSISQSYNVPTLSKSTRYRRTVLSTCDNSNNPVRRSTAYTQINVVPADGVITGRVTSSLGTGVSGVRVNVNRTTNVSGGTNANGSGTAITDGNGEYTISGLYYGGSSANFRVTPSRANHEFDPANRNITVNSSSPKSANFTDITVFTLTGNVSQDFGSTSCNIADIKVDLLFNGVVINPNDGYTDENGDYTLTIENQGTYTIRPQLTGHIFAPANATFFIDDNRSNVNFKDITQFSLQGKILAGAGTAEGCQQFMGTATVTLTDVDNCFTITGTTDGAGFFQITGIPSKVYNVKVTDLNPISAYASKELEIESFYDTNGRAVDLSSASQNEDFYYQAEPVIVVEGLPEPPCTYEYPVLAQSEVTPLLIQVFEEGTTCPVDTGTISINDQIGDMGDEPITFEFKGGSFEYNLKAGNPNIVSPHLKNLTISAIDTFERPSETYNPSVLVTGGRPRAQNFSTQSPQLPLFILRDPPGDASYSYLEENTTTETATRFYVSDSESSNTWGNVRIGLKFGVSILGLETETAFWGDVGGSYEVNSTNANSTETILSVSNTTRFETTDSDVIQGSEGDVFVGAALAFAYAISDEVIFDENTCQVLMDKNLVIANEGLESEFIFTENHIKASVIPELQDLRDHPNTTAAEQADYDNQILVWEQMLQRNDELKAAAEFVEVVQFGGNSPKEKTTTSTTTDISTIEFGMEINEEIASEMGFEIGGSGINGGLITNFKMESGNSTTETEINSLTTGYRLADDDPLDEFTVEVRSDPVYKTPVFVTLGGASSCPYEPETNAREAVQLRAENPIQAGVAADGTAVFTLFAGNISETDEDRTYFLRFIQATNIGGAAITVGGSPYTTPLPLDDIGAAGELPVTVTVTRGINSPIYSYEGLAFELYSGCNDADEEIIATVALSAFFQSPCSEINIVEPIDGFILSQANDNELELRLDGYDVNNLDRIEIEYTPRGISDWKPGVVLESSELNDSEFGTEVSWDIINVPDGRYDIRIKVICGLNISYSNRISGLVDRSAPMVLGTPEPDDDNYVIGDEISVKFTEDLGCSNLSAANVQLRRVFTNEIINAQLSCADNELFITPNLPITTEEYDAEKFEVLLSGVTDLYGNAMAEDVVWDFFVGGDLASLDFDGDGVPNPLDKCPGFDDSVDVDRDGIPDACDFCVNDPNPGMYFAGGNDRVSTTNISGLERGNAPHTVEAWIYLDGIPSSRSWPLLLGSAAVKSHHWLINSDGGTQLGVWSGQQFRPRLEPNRWYHIAIASDGENMTLYINGVKIEERVADFDFSASDFYIGQVYGSGFRGKMDEVRIWNRARTQSEIGTYLSKELVGDEEGLLVYYNFNEGTPDDDNTGLSIVQDKSLNGHDGTVIGMARTGAISNWTNGAPVNHLDVNNNRVGEVCEPDADMDGVPDYRDICAGFDDTIDSDADGIPDGCDSCEDAINPAMNLDGTDDYISLVDSDRLDAIFGETFTLEAWINKKELGDERILDKGAAGTALGFTFDTHRNKLRFISTNTSVAGTTTLSTDTWYHVAVVYDLPNQSLKLYLNGVLDQAASLTSAMTASNHPLNIGKPGSGNASSGTYNGTIDEVRIWTSARTADQIQANMAKELNGNEADLAIYYDFNEGLPSQDNTALRPNVFDKSGNSYTATLRNVARNEATSNWVEGAAVMPRDVNENGVGDLCEACEILDVDVVVHPCNEGTYNFTIHVAATNGSSTFYVDGDLTSGGYSYYEAITFVQRTGTTNFTIVDTQNPACSYEVTVNPPSDCAPGQRTINVSQTAQSVVGSSEAMDMSIQPNPAKQHTTIQFALPEASETSIAIYNSAGVLVAQFLPETTLDAGVHTYPLATSAYPDGFYMVVLKTAHSVLTKQLIVAE